MIAINKTNPTTLKTYVLSVFIFFFGFMSYGQAVFENFNGTYGTPGNVPPDFEVVGGANNGAGRGPGTSILLNITGTDPSNTLSKPSSLEYIGNDGFGKDDGIGTISFWYRTDATPMGPFDEVTPHWLFGGPYIQLGFFNGENYQLQYSIDNGLTYTALTNLNAVQITNYTFFTFTANIPGDNIRVRLKKVGTGIFLNIDDFQITNFYLTATWTGSTWDWNDDGRDGTTPTYDDKAILTIDGNYDTDSHGSFGGRSLTVNNGYTLRVNNSDFVEIDGDVVVEDNAELNVETQGSFIQRGVGAAAGTFTLEGSGPSQGSSQVNKFTAPLADWYNYTYWSSPVANADVDVALSDAIADRRYWYNAANYLDVSPQDDIDDGGAPDWTLATGTGAMVIGQGYAATHNPSTFIDDDRSYQYNFVGALNTGDVSYPLAYSPLNTGGHWNLVGNPYPSAISADELFDVNSSTIEGVAYLWSHITQPSGSFPGNEVLNFDQSDYITINASMPLGNGGDINNDGVIDVNDIPSTSIASGQGFFVISKDATSIVFNNFMRVGGNNANNQFFRSAENVATSTQPERLWINLSSDNGVYGQTGIAYVEGASNGLDEMRYDAKKNASNNTAASIYSIIDGVTNMQLAIQGKSPNDLSTEEVIQLGFSNNLTSPTVFTIKALKYEGEFLNSNAIYLKDNVMNTLHNLKDSDYSFTSEPGEFNERFEIVFSAESLSIDGNQIDENTLTITELTDGDVAFNVGGANTITNVIIYDMLGRQIYDLSGSNSREVYNLSNLGNAPYVAQVTLDNGQVIRKKAIKQN